MKEGDVVTLLQERLPDMGQVQLSNDTEWSVLGSEFRVLSLKGTQVVSGDKQLTFKGTSPLYEE